MRPRRWCYEGGSSDATKKYPELRFVQANSLDPLRAKQANEETRDAFFTRLDCFCKLLHRMGVWEFEHACDVPLERWFNFDEVSTDPTKRKAKVLVFATLARIFQITPEGDSLGSHVTTGVFLCANGE